MFLLIRKRLYGNRIIQGLQYGFCCCAIWVVYLLEPLPHVAPVDQLTYPLADSFALVVMGILTGLLLGKTQAETSRRKNKNTVLPVLAIAACFVSWRTIQYLVIDIYSSFDIEPVQTMAWCFLAGLVIALIMAWINMYIDAECRIKQSLILGGLLFGLNPVSYTHLDVYKRQATCNAWLTNSSIPSFFAAEIGTTGIPSISSISFICIVPPLFLISSIILRAKTIGISVSYTYLDVYKRQDMIRLLSSSSTSDTKFILVAVI